MGGSDGKNITPTETPTKTPTEKEINVFSKPDINTNGCFNFQFNYFNALVGLGAVLLVVAIVTLPPVATAIGLSALISAGTAGIVSASAGVPGLSLLAGLGWFACARKLEEGSEFLDNAFRS